MSGALEPNYFARPIPHCIDISMRDFFEGSQNLSTSTLKTCTNMSELISDVCEDMNDGKNVS